MVVKKAEKVKEKPEKPTRQAEAKWGVSSMQAGYTIVPNVLVTRHLQIGLDSVDLALIMQLASYWWTAGTKPFPSKKSLAKAVGRDVSVVRKRLKAMEHDKLIRRIFRKRDHGGNNTNQYDLAPLAKAVDRLSREEIADREKQRLGRLGRKAASRLAPGVTKL